MAYPDIYDVTYSYTGFQQSQGNNSFPGTQLDADLAGLQDTIEGVSDFLKNVIRSDGALNNGVVTYDSLSPSLQTAGLSPADAWVTAHAYHAGKSVVTNSMLYRALLDHTSGVFADDLADEKWVLVTALVTGPQGPAGTNGTDGADGTDGTNGNDGAGYGGTSTTSLAIGTGAKAFTTQADLAYQVGNYVRASSSADGTNFMEGLVTAYSGTTLTIDVALTGGSGTKTDWVFAVSGVPSGVTSFNGKSGAVKIFYPPQARLTLASGVKYMGTSQAGATSIICTPCGGNLMPLWNGADWVPTLFNEFSQATTDTTKAPAAMGPEECWDHYAWDDAGTIRLSRQRWSKTATVTMTIASPCVVTWNGHVLPEFSPVIFTNSGGALPTGVTAGTVYYVGLAPAANSFNIATSLANAIAGTYVNTSGSQSGTHTGENRTTARGYTHTDVQGIPVNTSAITNGPAAQRGTWLGITRSNASSTVDFIFPTFGVAGAFNVWNAYNQKIVAGAVIDNGLSYTRSSSTWRLAGARAINRIQFVTGGDAPLIAEYQNVIQLAAVSGAVARLGLGYDSTSTPSNNIPFSNNAAVALISGCPVPFKVSSPTPGAHFIAGMENADNVNSSTFNLGGVVSSAGLGFQMSM